MLLKIIYAYRYDINKSYIFAFRNTIIQIKNKMLGRQSLLQTNGVY